jgi:hypothetical protein
VRWQIETQSFLDQLERPLVVKYAEFVKIIGWLCLGVGIAIIVAYLLSLVNQVVALMSAGVFAILGLLVVLCTAVSIEVDPNVITLYSLFGKYRMQWAEVKQVLITPAFDTIALVGENKRLVIPGPAVWSGADKQIFAELMNAKITWARIVSMPSYKPYFWNSKNVRVRG